MSLRNARATIANSLFGRHLREVHFYFGTVSAIDVAMAVCRTPFAGAGDHVRRFETRCAQLLGFDDAVSFGSGRMALYAILEALGIQAGDEVIIPGFTCVVVPNAIRYRGATVVFVDIDRSTWNLDVDKVRQAITPKTRAIVVQHTFGVQADLDMMSHVARAHGIFIIEDSAHILLPESGRVGRPLSDACFFSFESSKPVTLGRGGIAAAADPAIQKRLRAVQEALDARGLIDSVAEGMRLLILTCLHKPSVFRFGKFVSALLFRAGIFEPNITIAERRGERPSRYPTRLTTFQALLGHRQLRKIGDIASHRKRLTALYDRLLRGRGIAMQAPASSSTNIRLRYSFLLPNPAEAGAILARRQVELGRWFDSPVTPVRLDDTNLPLTSYVRGMCPVAEEIVNECVNLPTDPAVSDEDATRAANAVVEYLAAVNRV